jgi:hypothetical protein
LDFEEEGIAPAVRSERSLGAEAVKQVAPTLAFFDQMRKRTQNSLLGQMPQESFVGLEIFPEIGDNR